MTAEMVFVHAELTVNRTRCATPLRFDVPENRWPARRLKVRDAYRG
jgi:hypothetical protein